MRNACRNERELPRAADNFILQSLSPTRKHFSFQDINTGFMAGMHMGLRLAEREATWVSWIVLCGQGREGRSMNYS